MDTAPVKVLRFADLKAAQIVTNWPQLRRLVDNYNFPPGYLLTPGCRVWDTPVVEQWLQSRRDASGGGREHSEHHAAA
jgi:hypothetical protein